MFLLVDIPLAVLLFWFARVTTRRRFHVISIASAALGALAAVMAVFSALELVTR